LLDLNGNQVHLSDFRGKAVVPEFLGILVCTMQERATVFMDFQKEYGPRGLQIIGVSMDDAGEMPLRRSFGEQA